MALAILDGTQTATTLSTILSGGQHITAHTVVSLGTQAITDMRSAVSGSVVSISNFPATQPVSIASVTIGNSLTIASLPAISGTVTANVVGFNPTPNNNFGTGVIQIIADAEKDTIRSSLWIANSSGNNGSAADGQILSQNYPMPISGTVTANLAGSFNATIETVNDVGNVSHAVAVHLYDDGGYFMGNGNNPVIISGTVTANTFAVQGTAVTTSNFTSTTASTVLANFNATREVLTIFNEGAGNLHICAGATCTTIAYQVRLSAGDYYEVPNHQTTITHSAVFATAGTARVTQVS